MSDINERAAKELFGWKWIAYVDTPVRGTPGYPSECKVRLFASPKMLNDPRWVKYWEEHGGYTDADGTEPLAYCYCSSRGFPIPPDVERIVADYVALAKVPGWDDFAKTLPKRLRVARRNLT